MLHYDGLSSLYAKETTPFPLLCYLRDHHQEVDWDEQCPLTGNTLPMALVSAAGTMDTGSDLAEWLRVLVHRRGSDVDLAIQNHQGVIGQAGKGPVG